MKKQNLKYYWILLACLSVFSGKAQQVPEFTIYYQQGISLMEGQNYQEAIKSFEKCLSVVTSEDHLSRAQATNKLAYCLIYTGKIEQSLDQYQQAFELSMQLQNPKLITETAAGISEIHGMRGQAKEANPYRRIVNKNALILEDWYLYSNSLSMTGYNYLLLGQLDSAKWYIEEGLRIKKEHQIDRNLFLNYNHLASLYARLNNYERAIEYHLRCIKLLEAKARSPQLVIQYNNLALIFISQKNLERAEFYINRAIELSKEMNLSLYYSAALSTLAEIRENQDRIEEALEYHKEALDINRASKNERGITHRLISIVKLYLKQGFFELAENYFLQAMPQVVKRNLPPEMTDAFLTLADLRIQQNLMPQARIALDSAELLIQEAEVYNSKSRLLILQSQYYEKLGQYEKALLAGQQASLLRDSIFNIEKSARIHELEEEYERAKKEKEITLLNSQQEIKDLEIAQNSRNIFIILIGLLLACGALILLYNLNQLRRRTNERLEEKNTFIAKALKEKEVLLNEIHYRVKNNLQLVSTLLQMQTDHIKDDKAIDALQEGQNRVKSMAIIHQNLYQEDNLIGVNIKDYIQRLSESLFHSYNIDAHRIQLKTQIDQINLDVDTLIPLGLILNELLTNALKYAFPEKQEGTVTVTLKEQESYLLLEVKDNGIGMEENTNSAVKTGGFGLKLLETFAVKLKAQLQIHQLDGTVVRLLIHKVQNCLTCLKSEF